MNRPKHSDYKDKPHGTYVYMCQLELYCDHIEKVNKETVSLLGKAVWNASSQRGHIPTTAALVAFLETLDPNVAKDFKDVIMKHLKTNKE